LASGFLGREPFEEVNNFNVVINRDAIGMMRLNWLARPSSFDYHASRIFPGEIFEKQPSFSLSLLRKKNKGKNM